MQEDYSFFDKNVIEFVRVSAEYCNTIDNLSFGRKPIFAGIQRYFYFKCFLSWRMKRYLYQRIAGKTDSSHFFEK